MPPAVIVLIIIAAVLVGVIITLAILGKKAQKKKSEQDEMMRQSARPLTLLVIDKKMMKLKDSGLPQQAIEKAGKLSQNAKLPIVKAKAGPKIMSLICDPEIFKDVPVKREIKAMVAGLYITSFRGAHGKIEKAPEKQKGIRGLISRLRAAKG